MQTIRDALKLLKHQTELESAIKEPGGAHIKEEQELQILTRQLERFPEATQAVLAGSPCPTPTGDHLERSRRGILGEHRARRMTGRAEIHRGRCLCGGVQYQVTGPLRGIIACHCGQCRQTSGHHVAATSAPTANLTLTNADTLSWYRSSETAERGFCNRCGGNLFWRPIGGTTTSIMAGTLDTPTHLKIERHIYVADKSDYYTLNDDAPKSPGP